LHSEIDDRGFLLEKKIEMAIVDGKRNNFCNPNNDQNPRMAIISPSDQSILRSNGNL
jgi:hypothetical protein